MKVVLTAVAVLVASGTARHHGPAETGMRALVPPSRAVSRGVTIKAMQFAPARITANVGDTIVWRNADVFSHTATAKGAFDTGEMKPGKLGKWIVKKRGVFNYACLFHPTMKAVIEVK